MNSSNPASYLRSCRKRSGLSQKDIAKLLGYPDEGTVSRHERLHCVPPLQIALCYEALYRVPVSERFSAINEVAEQKVETRLAEMEHDLQQCSAKGRDADMIARKLTWMQERRQSKYSSLHASDLR
jgi:transcriptional regulator with XRE-family HTH domain